MAITYVGTGTAFNRISSGTGWTWNKPGVSTGDLMIGSLIFDSGGSQRTFTLPTGWTQIRNAHVVSGGVGLQLVVAYKFAEAGDGSSWSGTIGVSTATAAAATAAYRGAQGIGVNVNHNYAGVATSCSTNSANNTVTNSWRLVVGGYSSGSASYTVSSNETARRITYTADDSGDTGALQGGIWDSDGVVSVASHSKSISRSANWSVALASIFFITPQTGTPATGTWESTLGKVEADADGEVHNDATLAITTPSLATLADGYGQPPVVTGTVTAPLPLLSTALTAGTDAVGSMSALLPVGVEFVGETRSFGVRVINVEADDRTIRVESRGVAD